MRNEIQTASVRESEENEGVKYRSKCFGNMRMQVPVRFGDMRETLVFLHRQKTKEEISRIRNVTEVEILEAIANVKRKGLDKERTEKMVGDRHDDAVKSEAEFLIEELIADRVSEENEHWELLEQG